MKTKLFNNYKPFLNIYPKDENNREINIYEFSNVILTGVNLNYPNTLLYSKEYKSLIKPINERTMSLNGIETEENFNYIESHIDLINHTPVFFFIYNFDNYYHFIYDTLTYLISYEKLKLKIPDLKILMYYPFGKSNFYPFVLEFLNLFQINQSNIVIAEPQTIYKHVYISNSYTHDIDSNLPPRKEIFEMYKRIVSNNLDDSLTYPKKIYVSRRSWIHNDNSNIGTNYTTRRKLINEDELVKYLTDNGYIEIFTEKLTTLEKINLFYNAESVVGAIGGGICNVLFSKPECKLIAINSPHFLDVNKRFVYSLNNVKLKIFSETENVEKDEYKKFMRVKCLDWIGEIVLVDENDIIINYTDNTISGWNNDVKFKQKKFKKCDCKKIDSGLNSAWQINMEKFQKFND